MTQPFIEPNQPFAVPHNENSGQQNGLFWFTCGYFSGDFLATKDPPDKKTLDVWLDKIVKCALWTNQLPQLDLPMNQYGGSKKVGGVLLDDVKKWSQEINAETDGLIRIIEESQDDIKLQTQHGDFVPWHMIDLDDGKFGLIDGEHARSTLPKYYDVAYWYMRVMTELSNPEISEEFLERFHQKLDSGDQKTFTDELRPVLAQRTVGAFWDAAHNPSLRSQDLTFHYLLKDKVIRGKLMLS